MHSELYWIDAPGPLRLAIMARPRAGDWLEDEIAHWKCSGVEIVVSLLQRDEVDDLGLGLEAALCRKSGIEFMSFPIRDRDVPGDAALTMRFAIEVGAKGKTVAVHCRAGIGRASLMAAALLIAQGVAPAAALSAIEKARGVPIPDTEAQRSWIMKLREP